MSLKVSSNRKILWFEASSCEGNKWLKWGYMRFVLKKDKRSDPIKMAKSGFMISGEKTTEAAKS